MPDNSSLITALDAAIATGALQVTVDGQTIRYRSLDEMLRTRRFLVGEDTSGQYREMKRPRCATINLGGF